jgi:hypothetical protein
MSRRDSTEIGEANDRLLPRANCGPRMAMLIAYPRAKTVTYKVACVPSQSGALAEFLQQQKNTFSDLAAAYWIGVNSVPLCEPSQNG